MRSVTHSQPKLLFFVTEDWYFRLHWLPLAKAIQERGYQVTVMTHVGDGAEIRASGLELIPLRLSRSGTNPFRELRLLWDIRKILRSERPEILHNIAQKPVLYGSLVGLLSGVPRIVNTLAGMGFVFSSASPLAYLLRPLFRLAYRLLFNRRNTSIIVQNPDDDAMLSRQVGIDRGRISLIRGVGIDLNKFIPTPEPAPPVVVTLASRLVWDKGVGEFIKAARLLKRLGIPARFRLVGKPDAENPQAIPEHQLQTWVAEGVVEWTGFRQDMATVLAESHIVCLPSYREGLPTILLEAAASGRPMVTTDAPGCREVVRDRENGLLVAVKDSDGLAQALRELIQDQAARARYGRASRALAESHFGIDRITAETLEVYQGK